MALDLPKRWSCTHYRAMDKTLRCPDCSGIMRRCCQSAIGSPHRDGCAEEKGLIP
jgi:hypothetical protein